MLNSPTITIIISTILGFLAGIGVGGGSLLIMYLTLIINLPYPQARILNLLFFLPSAIVTSLFRWKQGKLDIKKILPAIVAGSISAALFSWLSRSLDTGLLKKIFGAVLLIAGVREIFYKLRKQISSSEKPNTPPE